MGSECVDVGGTVGCEGCGELAGIRHHASPGNISSSTLTPCCDAEPIIMREREREREREMEGQQERLSVDQKCLNNDYFTFVNKPDPIYCLYFEFKSVYRTTPDAMSY